MHDVAAQSRPLFRGGGTDSVVFWGPPLPLRRRLPVSALPPEPSVVAPHRLRRFPQWARHL